MQQANETEQLIFDIARMEWDLFQNVQNTGGRASCQDDPDTFFKMRMSQWMVYSKEILESYFADMQEAMGEGRNLIFEKYGYMMETTYPEEYEELKAHLPRVSEQKAAWIEELAKIHVKWDEEVLQKYPHVRGNGRVLKTEEDSIINGSSSESYLKGEYKTYSEKTLSLIRQAVLDAVKKGENLAEQIMENEVKFFGYASLQDAEEKMR